MEKPIMVGLGEILWDRLFSAEGEYLGKHLGGAPANFAFHASQLGAEGIVASAIGRDALGKELVERLESLGLGTGYIQRTDFPTGTVTGTFDADGKATYEIHEGVAWDEATDNFAWATLAQSAAALCFGSLAQRSPQTRRVIQQVLASLRPSCLAVFDINLRQHYFSSDVITSSLALAHVFKLNDEELPVVAELLEIPGNETEIIAALWEKYPFLRVIALTRGAHGSTLITRFRRSDHPGHPLPPDTKPDTVGAGDSFTARLALGLLRFEDLDTLHDSASRLASFVCSQPGATPVHPASLVA
jgi:fructokinase